MKFMLLIVFVICQSLTGFGQDNPFSHTSGVDTFLSNFQSFKMDIQAAGIANIPAARFENEILIIEYIYYSEGENREGKMTLTFNLDTNRFEGNWQTNADNGNVYKGSLYLVFDEGGEASGKYKFANSAYRITIIKTKK